MQVRVDAARTTQKPTIQSQVPQTEGFQSQIKNAVAIYRTLRSKATLDDKLKALKVIRIFKNETQIHVSSTKTHLQYLGFAGES